MLDPLVTVRAGGSLAGNDSSDASVTMSDGSHDRRASARARR